MKKIILICLLSFVMIFGACRNAPVQNTTESETKATESTLVELGTTEGSITDSHSVESTTAAEDTFQATITDKFGNEITIEAVPEKVICFSPELVEIMFALGIGETLIGRSTYCDYPVEVLDVTDMGDLFNLNMETIIDAKPDLVLLSSMSDEALVKSLQEKGLTVVVLDADTSIDGVYSYIENIGIIFDIEESAMALKSDMQSQIKEIQDKVSAQPKPNVYFVVAAGEYTSTATPDTFIHDLIVTAGGENVASDSSDWMYSVEQLVEKDPDLLICSNLWDTKSTIMGLDGYKDLTAVKNNKVYEIDENIFYRQGPRLVEAVRVLAEIFHPEAMK